MRSMLPHNRHHSVTKCPVLYVLRNGYCLEKIRFRGPLWRLSQCTIKLIMPQNWAILRNVRQEGQASKHKYINTHEQVLREGLASAVQECGGHFCPRWIDLGSHEKCRQRRRGHCHDLKSKNTSLVVVFNLRSILINQILFWGDCSLLTFEYSLVSGS